MKRLFGSISLILVAAALSAQPAIAHQGNPDFRSEITGVTPASLGDGLLFSIQNFDDNVEFVNRSGKTVVVEGYDGEPYVRIDGSGVVEVNLNSPAYYLNEDRYADVQVPDRADAEAEPDWKEVDDNGRFTWHDHRSHYMGLDIPPQVKDESKETKVFDYTIPIEVGGEPAKVNGTLTWVGTGSKAPVIPFVILGLAIIAAIVFWLIRRRRNDDEQAPRSGDHGDRGDDPGESEAW